MKIIGPDEVLFGVDSLTDAHSFLTDYGLKPVRWTETGGWFEAQDGTALEIRARDDATLPAPLPTTTMLRKTTYGVVDQATVEEIAAELSKDREVTRFEDGSIEAFDDLGFCLGFRVTTRRPIDLEAELVNSPGARPQRLENILGATNEMECLPRTLSHIVYFVPDVEKAEAFYVDRLGFVCTDRFTDVGPFLKPQANRDHHTLFLIKTPPHMMGMEHLAFHMQGPTHVLMAGSRMIQKGYKSFWGPGRHLMGSNWFWYFNSPLGCNLEYDADMDLHDDSWEPRAVPVSPELSQVFLFENRPKWAPVKGKEGAGDDH